MSQAAPRSVSAPAARRIPKAALLAVLAAAALGVGACSDKITSVDPSFVLPEGEASPLVGLAVWREIPNQLYIFRTGDPDAEPPVADVLLDSLEVETDPPGQLNGLIRDSTAASAYQVYRREPNGGVLQLFDFASEPTRRWVDRGWEIYHFIDPDTVVPTRTYLGRGIIAGNASPASPLTNTASDQVRSVVNLTYTGPIGFDGAGDPSPVDSLFPMQWRAVENAAGYYIHVYQPGFNLVRLVEQIESGRPAPLFIGKSRDILVAYLPVPSPPPAPGTPVNFTMPSPNARPANARVMTVRQTRYGQEYLVRIAAVDGSNQLIAFTRGHFSQHIADLPNGVTLPGNLHAAYFLGAVKVTPSRPRPVPARSRTPEPARGKGSFRP